MENGSTSRRMQVLAPWALGVIVLAVAVVAGFRLWARLEPPAVVPPPPITVDTEVLRPRPFIRTERYTGTIEAEQRAVLASHLTAAVLAVPLREGAAVKGGELLMRLDDGEPLQERRRLEATARRIDADLRFWREQLRADEQLFKEGTVTERALEETRRMVKSLEASREENQHALEAAEVRLAYTTVTAPFDGYIQKVHLLPGELATPGRALIEVVAAAPLRAVVPLPQGDLERITLGAGVRLEVSAAGGAVVGGVVDRLYPALDTRTRTATFETLVREPGSIRPGMNVVAEVVIERLPAALVVGQQAVQWRKGEQGVFVVQEGVARWRPVKVSAPQAEQVSILEGLDGGEEVVLTPYAGLADGRPVEVHAAAAASERLAEGPR